MLGADWIVEGAPSLTICRISSRCRMYLGPDADLGGRHDVGRRIQRALSRDRGHGLIDAAILKRIPIWLPGVLDDVLPCVDAVKDLEDERPNERVEPPPLPVVLHLADEVAHQNGLRQHHTGVQSIDAGRGA